MLTDSQTNADRILNLKKENAVDPTPAKKSKIQETKYQCVVCQTNKSSLSELHWHQTYQHSTEELSLSVIGWKGLVKIVGPPPIQEKENTNQCSIYNSFSKKPSQFYYLSSTILRVKENQKENTEAPIDCSLHPEGKVEDLEENVQKAENYVKGALENSIKKDERHKEEIKEYINESSIESSAEDCAQDLTKNRIEIIEKEVKKDTRGNIKEDILEDSQEDIKKNAEEDIAEDIIEHTKEDFKENIKKNIKERTKEIVKEDIDSEVPSQSSKKISKKAMKEKVDVDEKGNQELNTVKEISMEDFVKCANKLCSELEQYKRWGGLKKAVKRKHIS